MSCQRPGILARGLTAKIINIAAAATASNINAEEFVKETSNSPSLMGIKV